VLEPLSGYLMLAERLWQDARAFLRRLEFRAGRGRRSAGWCRGRPRWSHNGCASALVPVAGEHPHEAHFLRLDSSKARSQLRWRPRLGLHKALDWTVQWYKAQARPPQTPASCACSRSSSTWAWRADDVA